METRIQFRVDEETKRLAQMMAESQGTTLSGACRALAEQLAEQQRKRLSHDQWLTEQVERAFEKLESEQSEFIEATRADAEMEAFKAALKAKV
ncbi:type II toxin-antitoxin system RelB/DinJ family antitoxin [Marinomonas fungiae]|uniref:RelB antitoxin n=1 Tax=Marinomonas fungiae TaxID=1137284 RepID=A0A0K6ISQ1_9GAMM|nr:type II toxin-antitoxin system RelB/DinJ family antitoxin [Marinomonas fungiae]CUB06367.1 RelB antitoxin [Marinomonas fungiae]